MNKEKMEVMLEPTTEPTAESVFDRMSAELIDECFELLRSYYDYDRDI